MLEGVSISHVASLGKTSNSWYNRYKYSGLFLKLKILLYAQIPNGFKILFFPMENMFFLIHCWILKICCNISLWYIWNVKSLILCKLPILFSTVKFKLGYDFSQFIHRCKIGIFERWPQVVLTSCFHFTERFFGFLNVALAGLLSLSQFMIKDGKLFFF